MNVILPPPPGKSFLAIKQAKRPKIDPPRGSDTAREARSLPGEVFLAQKQLKTAQNHAQEAQNRAREAQIQSGRLTIEPGRLKTEPGRLEIESGRIRPGSLQ